ncbi:MAG TPA: glycosyltransferase [Caulobacteraceae bacterium]|jgi:glycosyltransferase involved in cell wall biosynthesis
MAIPRVIHQLWKDHAVPARFAPLRESWARLHPGWELRLWSDDDLEALVARDYPQLLDTYRGYHLPICRADLGRYLVLDRYGGVYADLDREALAPIDPLLAGADFAIGLEPSAHLGTAMVKERNLSRLVCASLIASTPGHDVWRTVLAAIVSARHEPGPLDATGPFLLSRVFADPAVADQARFLPSALVNPVSNEDCWSGRVHDLEFREAATRGAQSLHYWYGSWHRQATAFDFGLSVETPVRVNRSARRFPAPDGRPLVSCLMDATGDIGALGRAVDAFQRQTYAPRELVVAVREPAAADALARYADAGVRTVLTRAPSGLREAARMAGGEVVAIWSEGDLHDPRRLAVQARILQQLGADACVLGRWAQWRPRERRLGVVGEQPLPTSLMCLAAALDGPGEDAASLLGRLMAETRVASFDLSRLVVRVDPGADETPLAIRFDGERYDAVLTELATRLPVEDVLRQPAPDGPVGVRHFGRFRAPLGTSHSARDLARAWAGLGAPAALYDTCPHDIDAGRSPALAAPLARGRTIDVVHLAPAIAEQAQVDGLLQLAPAAPHRRRVAVWAWEIEDAPPPRAVQVAPLFDEIWTSSEHSARALRAHVSTPVVVIPEAVAPPSPSLARPDFGLPASAFVFLFSFDSLSLLLRKNPGGVVAAYLRAFPNARADVRLVLKATNLRPEEAAALREAIGARDDIQLIDCHWPAERWFSLLAACDAYVSLHHAEGFGRGMAEAMFYAKPVIATGYSGNLEFMDAETAYLVPFEMVEVGCDVGPFRAAMRWAEPDIDAAARMMAALVADPAAGRVVGARAAARVQAELSLEAIGARAAVRLAALAASMDTPTRPRRTRGRQPPKVLALTPVKGAAPHLSRYAELLERMDWPHARLSVALLESDSGPDDSAALVEASRSLACLARVETHRADFGFHPSGERWRPDIQRQRREMIARSRNRLVQAALRDEDWVLWLDVDLADYPPDLLGRLLDAGHDIVVPHCLDQTGDVFDLNTWRRADGARDDPTFLIDGLYQPPRGHGRLYLDSFANESLTPVDAVGGTALLVRTDLHRDGLVFPTFPYRGYIDTEGLAMMAKDMGRQSWGLPQLIIAHS